MKSAILEIRFILLFALDLLCSQTEYKTHHTAFMKRNITGSANALMRQVH